MKAAVLVARNPEYRLLAPVIDAALARGWTVECWHDYGQPQDGPKGYQFPSISSAPSFVNGRPQFASYANPSELQVLINRANADALISVATAQSHRQVPAERPRTWASLQYVVDSIINHTPEQLLAGDVLAFYSDWWIDWAAGLYEAEGAISTPQSFRQRAREKAAFVGLTELDATRLVDRREVRRRWGIPQDQPVVLHLPFGLATGREAFWPRKIFLEPNPLKRALNVLASGRFEFWADVQHGRTDMRVMQALRTFCDRSGAYLLVKSRRKTPIPVYVEALADRCLYDDSFYPATIVEALSIASLCVSYYSGAVLESIPLGVPHLCLTFDAEHYLAGSARLPPYFERFFTIEEGGLYQFQGAASTLPVSEAVGRLAAMTLQEFPMNRDAQARYVEKFLTRNDGTSAARTLDAIEQCACDGVRV